MWTKIWLDVSETDAEVLIVRPLFIDLTLLLTNVHTNHLLHIPEFDVVYKLMPLLDPQAQPGLKMEGILEPCRAMVCLVHLVCLYHLPPKWRLTFLPGSPMDRASLNMTCWVSWRHAIIVVIYFLVVYFVVISFRAHNNDVQFH